MLSGLSSAGITVTEDSSLENMAVFACVRIISQALASLPLIIYERRGRERVRAVDHPLYAINQTIANEEMTAFELRESRLAHCLLWGNSYAEIEYDDNFNVVGLWPLPPDRVGIERERDTGKLRYTIWSDTKGGVVLPDYRVQHLRYTMIRGAVGISPIRMAMNAIGLSQATEEFGSKYFRNGSRPSIILKHPGRMSDDAFKRLRSSFENSWSGLSNAHRINILEEGITPEAIGIPNEEAQFLQTRRFQLAEIARLYAVPLNMLAENEGTSTYASAEQDRMNFDQYTLLPWVKRDEQALMRDLLTPKERTKYYIEYLIDGLTRADVETRYGAYMTGKQGGWLSTNEIRARENLNPVAGGDTFMEPLNMAPAASRDEVQALLRVEERDELIETRAEADIEQIANRRRRVIARQYGVFEDVSQRLANREIADMRRAVKKYLAGDSPDLEGFRAWMESFYVDLRGVIPGMYRALLVTVAEAVGADVARELGEEEPALDDTINTFIDEYLGVFASQYVFSGQDQINLLIDENPEEAEAVVNQRLDGWAENRATKTARSQTYEAGNALVIAWYGALSVTLLRWAGGDCDFCRTLNGKTVGIDGFFVQGGTQITGENGEPMLVRRNTRHGPLHQGCDCTVIAG